MIEWAKEKLSLHGPAQGGGALYSAVTHSTPIGYLLVALLVGLALETYRFVLGEMKAERAAARHRDQVKYDLNAVKDSGTPVIVKPSGMTDEWFKPASHA